METIIKKGKEYNYDTANINKVVNNTIDKIKKIVDYNQYQILGKIDYYNLNFNDLSKNQKKKIQKYCYWIDNKPTLRKINTLFTILSNNFNEKKVKIKNSKREERIQKARKEWVKSRNEYDKLLDKYKKEKGDYYKSKNY